MKIELRVHKKIYALGVNDEYEWFESSFTREFEYSELTTIEMINQEYPEFYLYFFNYYTSIYMDLGVVKVLPYLLVNNILQCDVEYQDARLIDFIKTHNISDEVHININYAEIGDAIFFKDIIELWDVFLPILSQLADIIGIYGAGRLIFSKLSKKFKKNNIPPNYLMDFTYNKNYWNPFEYSKYLGISFDDSKNLIKGFGYKWDRKTQLYMITDTEKDRFLKLFNNINYNKVNFNDFP